MKAILLAGGYAKRLWPLTRDCPKSLLPVAGKPMIDSAKSSGLIHGDRTICDGSRRRIEMHLSNKSQARRAASGAGSDR